jgi:hypothetical protein
MLQLDCFNNIMQAELTLRAIIGLPIAVANAHIVASALAVAVTAIGALGAHHGDGGADEAGNKYRFHGY